MQSPVGRQRKEEEVQASWNPACISWKGEDGLKFILFLLASEFGAKYTAEAEPRVSPSTGGGAASISLGLLRGRHRDGSGCTGHLLVEHLWGKEEGVKRGDPTKERGKKGWIRRVFDLNPRLGTFSQAHRESMMNEALIGEEACTGSLSHAVIGWEQLVGSVASAGLKVEFIAQWLGLLINYAHWSRKSEWRVLTSTPQQDGWGPKFLTREHVFITSRYKKQQHKTHHCLRGRQTGGDAVHYITVSPLWGPKKNSSCGSGPGKVIPPAQLVCFHPVAMWILSLIFFLS